MKTLIHLKPILLFSLLLYGLTSVAQLKADAGEDIVVCNVDESEYKLGGLPAASGGIQPYIYTWSIDHSNPDIHDFWISASDILGDTTASNPTIKSEDIPVEQLTLFLKVEDAVGEVVYDSVQIFVAAIWIQLIYIDPDTIFRGDSIQFYGDPYFSDEFLPFSYSIWPSYGLTDSTNIYGWAKPDTSITYYIQATNSVGCVSEQIKYWHIEVIDTTTNSIYIPDLTNNNIDIFPNPSSEDVTISNPSNFKIKNIKLVDLAGRTIQQWDNTGYGKTVLQLEPVLPGIYLLKIETELGTETKKLVVQ